MNNDTNVDARSREFLNAAANLLAAVAAQAQLEDRDTYAALAGVMRAGGLCVLRATLTGTGLGQVAVDVVEPSGAVHVLASVELQRQAAR